MKERPIIFGADSVRAILAGRKSQTRRVIRPDWWRCWDPEDEHDQRLAAACSPYGHTGDRLWVRETWKPTHSRVCSDTYVRYAANDERRVVEHQLTGSMTDRWRPPIFMPRWASRLMLRVDSVRVERLQEISEADAIAEGAAHAWLPGWPIADFGRDAGTARPTAVWPFQELWDSINGKRAPWASNPFVWVVTFTRAELEASA